LQFGKLSNIYNLRNPIYPTHRALINQLQQLQLPLSPWKNLLKDEARNGFILPVKGAGSGIAGERMAGALWEGKGSWPGKQEGLVAETKMWHTTQAFAHH
jgi:hypothetical protein